MLQRYKELFYGLLFGLGAAMIDVFMHASTEQQSFGTELFRSGLAVAVFRGLFIIFGMALGWVLWRKNKVERDFRNLLETVEQFRRDISAPALLVHTKLEQLLARSDCALSPEAEKAVRYAYEKSREIGRLAEKNIPFIPEN